MVDTCIIYISKEYREWRKKEYQGCKNYWVWQVWISLYSSGSVYNKLEMMEHNSETKLKIKDLILKELDNYKKEYIYFSYEHLDLYVEKLYEHYCYIHEDEMETETVVAKVESSPHLYDEVMLKAFATGKLF